MATGIPGIHKNCNQRINSIDYHLEYEGKHPIETIMCSDPASLERVVSVEGEPVNRLIYGDNLRALRALLNHQEVAGKVRLIYIDPPYATRSRFESRKQEHAYYDTLWGAKYLEFLRERLILMRELLADDGSIYVHLDDNMVFQVKLLMDEIFGYKCFRNFIVRKKCNTKNFTRRQYGNIADYILFYTKTDEYVWNQPVEPWSEEAAIREYPYVDEKGRRYKKVPIHAPGVRHGATGREWRGKLPPPGKHWQYPPEKLDELDARGEIYWSPNGNPRRKVYLDNSAGIPVQDIWLEFKDAHNQNIDITGYPTEKNLALLRRIVAASSNPSDLVLDAFAGSGTTAHAAEELGRQWIMIDSSLQAIETMVWRLANGTAPMGDFVTGLKPRPQQQSLFGNRVLRSGLEVFVDNAADLDLPPVERIAEWRRLLADR